MAQSEPTKTSLDSVIDACYKAGLAKILINVLFFVCLGLRKFSESPLWKKNKWNGNEHDSDCQPQLGLDRKSLYFNEELDDFGWSKTPFVGVGWVQGIQIIVKALKTEERRRRKEPFWLHVWSTTQTSGGALSAPNQVRLALGCKSALGSNAPSLELPIMPLPSVWIVYNCNVRWEVSNFRTISGHFEISEWPEVVLKSQNELCPGGCGHESKPPSRRQQLLRASWVQWRLCRMQSLSEYRGILWPSRAHYTCWSIPVMRGC